MTRVTSNWHVSIQYQPSNVVSAQAVESLGAGSPRTSETNALTAAGQGGGGLLLCWYVDFIDPEQWKDEDHFAHIQRLGWVSPEKAAAIRREGEQVIERIERKSRPFDEPWPSWRVNPSWPRPALPDDWATVPA